MNARFQKDVVIPRRSAESQASLSFAQERLWFLDALGAGGSYHMPIALKLAGQLEFSALEDALRGIVARHADRKKCQCLLRDCIRSHCNRAITMIENARPHSRNQKKP